MEINTPSWLSYPETIASALEASLQRGLVTLGQELSPRWHEWVEEYQQSLGELSDPQVLLAETESAKVWAAVVAFLRVGRGALFIANHQWQQREWQQVAQFLHPDRLWGSSIWQQQWLNFTNSDLAVTSVHHETITPENRPDPKRSEPLIGFATGGSSGTIRFALHSPQTLTVAVGGLRQFLAPLLHSNGQINSLCLLPLYHVGGFMQWWRSALTGGDFSPLDYGLVKQSSPPLPPNYVISLVPTQLEYLLDRHGTWLKNFRLIFLGGAPAWPALLTKAKTAGLNLAPTYGMTETAAQIATLTPGEFLAGQTGVGRLLPHVRLTISNPKGEVVEPGTVGVINIQSDALFKGYVPQGTGQKEETFTTGDLGYCHNGYLHITGRQGRRLISGGENIDPEAIEAFLLEQNLVQDVVIVGVGDRHWGDMLVAVYVPNPSPGNDVSTLKQCVKAQLSKPKCPKHWLPVSTLRRSPLGKLNYQFWQTWATEQLGSN
ncbi:2-succinylbenzoate--CoA ligase [Synechocystis sp. PCC 7339]|uniref:2-succinylbenzoate--CoA ligase n=1 Tax=unclassified Synechocystis TaxID=2640012 RepID=UPI001BB03587|nr:MULTISPECIES: 2-succinylbenzoate--CoA ligase [unclassified Synechocystis]QUS60110.1 2-succinylbenzoate--CoA ligase [Synechocystis sp. PCC 7338]UAJ72442.1 2-succinylbenzoate--CoA ligase [Synechocystis sp. PCC 7339]